MLLLFFIPGLKCGSHKSSLWPHCHSLRGLLRFLLFLLLFPPCLALSLPRSGAQQCGLRTDLVFFYVRIMSLSGMQGTKTTGTYTCYCPHFTYKETEAMKGLLTCPMTPQIKKEASQHGI